MSALEEVARLQLRAFRRSPTIGAFALLALRWARRSNHETLHVQARFLADAHEATRHFTDRSLNPSAVPQLGKHARLRAATRFRWHDVAAADGNLALRPASKQSIHSHARKTRRCDPATPVS